jgi:hypothetical protein
MTDGTPKRKDGQVGDSPRLARAYADLQKELKPGEDPLYWDWRATQKPLSVEERKRRVQAFADAERAKAASQGEVALESGAAGQWFGPSTTDSSVAGNAAPPPENVIDVEVRTSSTPAVSLGAKSRPTFTWMAISVVIALAASLVAVAIHLLGRDVGPGEPAASIRAAATAAVATPAGPLNTASPSERAAPPAAIPQTSSAAAALRAATAPSETPSSKPFDRPAGKAPFTPRPSEVEAKRSNVKVTEQPVLPPSRPEKRPTPASETAPSSEDTFSGSPTF